MGGLDPEALFSVHVEFIRADEHYYQYSKTSESWKKMPDPKMCEQSILPPAYVHPDSPMRGKDWSSSMVKFSGLRLSNRSTNDSQARVSCFITLVNSFMFREQGI